MPFLHQFDEIVETGRRENVKNDMRPPRAGATHLHGFRHTRAVELVREVAPLPEVQAQLGRSSLAVTSGYLD